MFANDRYAFHLLTYFISVAYTTTYKETSDVNILLPTGVHRVDRFSLSSINMYVDTSRDSSAIGNVAQELS